MRVAHFARRSTDLPALPLQLGAACYRLGGLLLTTCVPTGVWVVAVVLTSQAAGIPISLPALAAFGLVVGILCFASAAIVMADRH
jgi:hypothetical protein